MKKETKQENEVVSFSVKTNRKGINFIDFESAYQKFKALKKLNLEPAMLANYADSTCIQVF